MTSIATKSGLIILKNGSVAENCNCCTPSLCNGAAITGVTVKITSSGDLVRHSIWQDDADGTLYYVSFVSYYARLNGTHVLTKDLTHGWWSKSITPYLQNQGGSVYCGYYNGTNVMDILFNQTAGVAGVVDFRLCTFSATYASYTNQFFSPGHENMLGTFCDGFLPASSCDGGQFSWVSAFPASFTTPRPGSPGDASNIPRAFGTRYSYTLLSTVYESSATSFTVDSVDISYG